MIICIEGIDASGKNTQAKRLAEALDAERFSFPDYTTIAGGVILEQLKEAWEVVRTRGQREDWHGDDKVNALVLQGLMAVNRLERGGAMRVAAARGHVVLDRYDASSMVYGSIDGCPAGWIEEINRQLPIRPDIYLLIDVPVEESVRRRPERRDRYEQDVGFLERVRAGYLALFERKHAGHRHGIARLAAGPLTRELVADVGDLPAWRVVDGFGTVEEVGARIAAVLGELGVAFPHPVEEA